MGSQSQKRRWSKILIEEEPEVLHVDSCTMISKIVYMELEISNTRVQLFTLLKAKKVSEKILKQLTETVKLRFTCYHHLNVKVHLA